MNIDEDVGVYHARPVQNTSLAGGHFAVSSTIDDRLIGVDLKLDEQRARVLAFELNKAFSEGMESERIAQNLY